MAASQCAITFRQKSGRVQEDLNMIHYPRVAACLFTFAVLFSHDWVLVAMLKMTKMVTQVSLVYAALVRCHLLENK